ncbi:MAG: hypothetical protein AAF840_17810, partial [Bacteroidota bacterium]
QVNNDYFTVERSQDGRQFTSIGQVPVSTNARYNFRDETPLPGLSFYRVQQTDFDGRFSYSRTVSSQRQLSDIHLYPSLVRAGQLVNIELPESMAEQVVTVSLTDQNGRTVQRQQLTGAPRVQLVTRGLPAAVYQVSLYHQHDVWTGRLVIR